MFNRQQSAVQPSPNANGPDAVGYVLPVPMNQAAKNLQLLPLNFVPNTTIVNPAMGVVIPNPSYLTQPLLLALPSHSPIEGQPFDVVVSGVCYTSLGAQGTTFRLHAGQSLTPADNILLASFPALASANYTGAVPFTLRAALIADSLSGMLTGTQSGKIVVNYAADITQSQAEMVIDNTLTGLNFADDPVVRFLLSVAPYYPDPTGFYTINKFEIQF